MVAALHVAAQLLLRPAGVELRVVLHRLGKPVVAGHRRVVGQHVEDEPLLDRLLHGVAVEGMMPDAAVRLQVRGAEDLQRLVLGRGREREVAGVVQQLARLHHAVDPVLVGLLIAHLACFRQRLRHGRAGAAALAGVRLVDDDREAAPALLVADLVQDERELLDRGDDDLLAALDEPAQIARALGGRDRRPHLGVLPDRVPDLTVEDDPVGDHDDRVEDRRVVPAQPDQLVSQPGDGVALAAAGRVLDQVAPARAVGAGVGQQPAHHVELMVARPDLGPSLPAALLVLRLHHLGVVLQDVGEAPPGQHLPPQVVDRQPVRVGRVARAVVPAPVERQEPRRLAGETGAELHLALVHREVRDAAPELEQLLARVAILLVLQHRVVRRLLGETVLQLEREHRQPVDEQPDVQRPLRLVPAIAKLPGDGEAVLLEPFLRRRVVSRGRAVEQVQVQRPVLDPVTQHLDRAALDDLALQPGQERAPRRTVLRERQGLGGLRLGVTQERRELHLIDAVLAVKVVEVAAAPPDSAVTTWWFGHRARDGRIARMPGQSRADQSFQPALGGVCGHVIPLPHSDRDLTKLSRLYFVNNFSDFGIYLRSRAGVTRSSRTFMCELAP